MTTPVTLDSVSSAFNQWRETRRSQKTAVPDALREQAIELLNHYKPSHVIASLKINHSMLKRWRGIGSSSNTTTFVPLTTNTSNQPMISTLEMTLQNLSGSEMRVKGELTPAQLAHFVRAFMQREVSSL